MKKLLSLLLLCLMVLGGCAPAAVESAPAKSNAAGTQAVDAGDSSDTGTDINTLPSSDATSDIIEISEKVFIAQTNDIYINTDDYLNRIIKYEGIFQAYHYDVTDTTYYSVIRYGPGCCGFDANAGFEVEWDGDYPEQNDWVEAVGTLETYEEGGAQYLRLKLSSLKVLPVRGAEFVQQ